MWEGRLRRRETLPIGLPNPNCRSNCALRAFDIKPRAALAAGDKQSEYSMSLTLFADAQTAATRVTMRLAAILTVAFAALFLAGAAIAQDVASVENPTELDEVTVNQEAAADTASAYTPMGPDMIKGQPTAGAMDVQKQYSDIGQQAFGLHVGLVWVMAIISIFVLALLVLVIVRYNRRANPTPSRTTHNTAIEVVWTIVPALILVAIAIPSISLLAAQYESPPEDAITVKVAGVQWHWEYEFPDHEVSIISKMLNEPGQAEANPGVRELGSEPWDGPGQLEVDNRLVLPVGVPLRMQVTANDVIHSFAVPALWFKIDAVPGRLNERLLTINEPGIYYGQCSELCGVKHGYMPIAIEALPLNEWRAWVSAQGGSFPEARAAAEAAEAAPGSDDAAADEAEAAADTAA